MASNPFEDEDGSYFALINEEGQYSLWPAFLEIPDGWSAVHGEADLKSCTDYVEENWTDMRPKSLIEEMARWEKSNGGSKSASNGGSKSARNGGSKSARNGGSKSAGRNSHVSPQG